VQNRVDILSRPQIMTLDNQTALINVGKEIPIVTGTTLTATGLSQQSIDRRQVGVILQVTPKIGPDGQILMRIIPEVSAVDPVPVNLGNGNIGTALDIQHVETTVTAYDGETIALAGLLSKSDTKTENKVPWFGDLPGVGVLFRYRTQNKMKKELIFIMTPHVVRCRADADRILAEESRKMDWFLNDVLKMHGNATIDPLSMGPFPKGDHPNPVQPKNIGPRFEEAPAPKVVPNVLPPGSTSQAPMLPLMPVQPLAPNQTVNGVPISNAPTNPAILPQALPYNPTTTSQLAPPIGMQQGSVQHLEIMPPIRVQQSTTPNNPAPPQLLPTTYYQTPNAVPTITQGRE